MHIHHTALIVSDYARSKRFYTEILGLQILAEHYRAARDSWKLDLGLNGQYVVELFSFPNPPPRPGSMDGTPEACGLPSRTFPPSVPNCKRWALPASPSASTNTPASSSSSSKTRTACRWSFTSSNRVITKRNTARQIWHKKCLIRDNRRANRCREILQYP